MASVIFAEQTLSDFALNESVGFYMSGRGSQFELMAGKTYRVIWDNEEYICTAYEGSYLGMTYTTVYLGNESYVTGQNTEIVEPFVIYYISDNDYNAFVSVSTETSHVIAIYEVDESEEDNTEDEVSKGCSIILYDRTGAAVTYENVETITTDTPDSGVQAVFTHGEVMQGVEVELALAEGDQTLSVPEGYLVKEAVIKKPETLLPEHIKKNIEIAGVVGAFAGDEMEKMVDLAMVAGDQVIEADEDTVLTKVIVRKPETLVSENILEGVEIGGVVGTHYVPQLNSPYVLYGIYFDNNLKSYNISYNQNAGQYPETVELCSSDGEMILAVQNATNETGSDVLITAPQCSFPKVIGDDIEFVEFEPGARNCAKGFRPSVPSKYYYNEILIKNILELENLFIEPSYGCLFYHDSVDYLLTPANGFYLPKKMDMEYPHEYDPTTGRLRIDYETLAGCHIKAKAEESPWLNKPQLSTKGTILTVDYIDRNAETTTLLSEDVTTLEVADERTGLISYEVESKIDGASYGFVLQSDGYYKENTAGGVNRAAVCKIKFKMITNGDVSFNIVNYGYSSYDYGIISKLDCELDTGYYLDLDTSSKNVSTNYKSSNSTTVRTYTFKNVSAGEHFICFKYRRYYTSSSSYYFKFKLATMPSEKTQYDLVEHFSTSYWNKTLTAISVATGYEESEQTEITLRNQPIPKVDKGILTVSNVVDGVTAIQIYVDDILVDTVAFSSEDEFSVEMEQYVSDVYTKYDVSISAIGEGIVENRSDKINAYVYLSTTTAPIYGVSGLYTSAVALTRTDDATGMTYTKNEDGSIISDFDNVFPWNKAQVVTDEFGNKFLQMPRMWFRVTTDSAANITAIAVSEIPVAGETNWYEVEPFAYACYGASSESEKMRSVSGVERKIYEVRSYARKEAENVGDNYHQIDLYHLTVMRFLWWIEWATKQYQNVMPGRCAGSVGANSNGISKTGNTDVLETPSGTESEYGQMRWHYIEDFIGNLFEWMDGIYCIKGASTETYSFVETDPKKFKYCDTFRGKKELNKLSYANPTSDSGCLAAFGWDDENPFCCIPHTIVTNYSYNTYFCDRYYTTSTMEEPCVRFGIAYNFSNSGEYGFTYFSNEKPYDRLTNMGSHLLYSGKIETS